MNKKLPAVILSLSMLFAGASCSEKNIPAEEEPAAEAVTEQAEQLQEEESPVQNEPEDNEFIDNAWAAFLVSPAQPAYTKAEDGYRILDVLCKDSVIGDIASMSRDAQAPEDTMAYDDKVITAGGPVSTGNLAYGRLAEIPQSYLDAMVAQMKEDIGYEYGEHSKGAGMGYRTFYQASYDSENGGLQVNQENGYWARTLGAYSEHCAGVAIDFDISYDNSEYISAAGRWNRGEKTPANVEFTWLADNAHKYGFIWRFKIDGSSDSFYGMKTGTIREGWHWRFVGVYNATKFWEACASDIDGDGTPEGYTTNDNYIWEDYYVENIHGNARYPQDMLEAFTKFYNSPEGTRCSYDEYISR